MLASGMLRAIFYARFHPRRGPSVVHQHPPGAIIASGGGGGGLLSFSDITSYIIPPHALCNRPLSICTKGFRILGFPVSLEDERYERTERNRFTFNVCFVLSELEDSKPWESVVSKVASFFIDLEESEGLLQAEEQLAGLKWAGEEAYPAANVGTVHEIIQSTFTQLNLYRETYVEIRGLHVLNLQLDTPETSDQEVRAWDVPLLIRALPDVGEWTWDLTLRQIHTHIDGVNHIQRIAELADAEVGLVGKTVRELIRHHRVMLLDIFHFQAVYMLTADFAWFINDKAMKNDCAKYVAKDDTTIYCRSLIELYRDLGPGTTVKDFYISHETQLAHVDIRRFITFGVIKGFVRRVHKFPFSLLGEETATGLSPYNGSPTKQPSSVGLDKERDQAWKRAAFSSGWTTPPPEPSREVTTRPVTAIEAEQSPQRDAELQKFLNGKHCMDEMCVSLHLTEIQVLEKLRASGEHVIFAS